MDYPPLSSSPLQLTPSLLEAQIQRIANTADNLIKAMSPTVETKQLKNNKKVSKEVEVTTFVYVFKNMFFCIKVKSKLIPTSENRALKKRRLELEC